MIIAPAQRLQAVEEYYFSRKLAEIRRRTAAGEDIINLGIGNPDLPPPEEGLRGLASAAAEPQAHGYQPYAGIPALRRAFADWYLRTYGATLDPEREILPLMGSKEGIMHLSMAFLDPGDRVLVPNPGYPTYAAVARLLGAEVVEYELRADKGWLPDLEALSAGGLEGVKLMWVNYPHMPTGALAPAAWYPELLAFARRHSILLASDNPYSLVLNPQPLSLLALPGAKELAVELNSLSKSHNMAGWRVGMIAGAEGYVQAVLRVKSNMDSGMFLPVQAAAVAALGADPGWHEARNAAYRRRREQVGALFRRLGCTFSEDQAGLFVWAAIPEGFADGFAFSDHLLDRYHLFMTPGGVFGSAGQGYIRASLCAPEERLAAALSRIEPEKNI